MPRSMVTQMMGPEVRRLATEVLDWVEADLALGKKADYIQAIQDHVSDPKLQARYQAAFQSLQQTRRKGFHSDSIYKVVVWRDSADVTDLSVQTRWQVGK